MNSNRFKIVIFPGNSGKTSNSETSLFKYRGKTKHHHSHTTVARIRCHFLPFWVQKSVLDSKLRGLNCNCSSATALQGTVRHPSHDHRKSSNSPHKNVFLPLQMPRVSEVDPTTHDPHAVKHEKGSTGDRSSPYPTPEMGCRYLPSPLSHPVSHHTSQRGVRTRLL